MALLKCPDCGKEVSSKAERCPNCGCPIDDIINSSEAKSDDIAITTPKENYDKTAKSQKKTTRNVIIICGIVVIIVIAVMCTIFLGSRKAQKEETGAETLKKETECIDFYESLLGRKLQEDKSLALQESDRTKMENVSLFGIIGDVTFSIPKENQTEVVGVTWTSKESCDDKSAISLLHGLEKIYGKHKQLENISDVQGSNYNYFVNSHGILNWEEDGISAMCGYDENNKIVLNWEKADREKNVKQDTDQWGSEQIEMGYNSMIELPENSPVTVSGIAREEAEGIYSMEIFALDLDDVDPDTNGGSEKKSIFVIDSDKSQSYDKRYISVHGYKTTYNGVLSVNAVEITDESESFLEYGGILPE